MTLANKVRIGWGFGFLAAAGFNLIYTLRVDNTAFWEWFLENAWFTLYKDMIVNIIIPYASILIVITVIFEAINGLLILNKLRLARLGLVLAFLWPIFLLPYMPFGLGIAPNLLLAIGPALLLMREYETTFWELLRARF